MEIAIHSVDHMYSLYFEILVILVISLFCFEGWISWSLHTFFLNYLRLF